MTLTTEISNLILAALALLDPNLDTDWTTAGLPSVDRVKAISENDTITRAMITEAAPEFSRLNRVLPAALADPDLVVSPDPDPETDQEKDAATIEAEKVKAEAGCPDGSLDAIKLFEAAVAAATGERYRRNSALQGLVTHYQNDQTTIKELQKRLDDREARRTEARA